MRYSVAAAIVIGSAILCGPCLAAGPPALKKQTTVEWPQGQSHPAPVFPNPLGNGSPVTGPPPGKAKPQYKPIIVPLNPGGSAKVGPWIKPVPATVSGGRTPTVYLTPVSLKDYDRALNSVENRLDSAIDVIEDNGRLTGLKPGAYAKQLLSKIKTVRTPDGIVYNVDTDSLISDLSTADGKADDDDRESDYLSAKAGIQVLRQSMKASARGSLHTVKSVDVMRRILNESDYESDPIPPPTPVENWMKRTEATISRWWSKLFPKTAGPNLPPINPKLLRALIWIFCAVLFGFFVWIIVQMIGRRRITARPISLSSTEEALVEARDKDTLITLAEKQAKSGDHRAAFRLVYLALLIALDTNGVLRFDRSKTNWEYIRALRYSGRQDVYDLMAPLTRDFDRLWYGLSRAGAEDYRRAVLLYEQLTAPPAADRPGATKKAMA